MINDKCNWNAGTFLLLFLILFLGFCGYFLGVVRGAQLLIYFLLFPVLLASNIKGIFKTLSLIVALVLLALYCFYAGIQGFLFSTYQSSLNSGFVIESLANTNPEESLGFLKTNYFLISCWVIGIVTFFAFFVWLLIKIKNAPPVTSKYFSVLILVSVVALGFGIYQRSFRNHFPLSVLVRFCQSIDSQQDYWEEIGKANQEFRQVADETFRGVSPEDQTIVLVIGESTNREDMSLYGYARTTTPLLDKAYGENANFLKAGTAFSTRFSTVAAFNTMMEFPTTLPDKLGSILAFYQKAGFHITWISNQDDKGIKAEYQSWADKQVNLNRLAGRGSTSMDEKVLPELADALKAGYRKSLIVVHLIGIHPHFSLRYPSDLKPTWEKNDEVSQRMKKLDRSTRTQILKEQYDLSMLYQDKIIADTLKLSQAASSRKHMTWIFLSDHGAETGERGDLVGHSSKDIGGYSIPFLFWTNEKNIELKKNTAENRPFRGDWLPYLLLDLAQIKTNFSYESKSWINPKYQWTMPDEIKKILKPAEN